MAATLAGSCAWWLDGCTRTGGFTATLGLDKRQYGQSTASSKDRHLELLRREVGVSAQAAQNVRQQVVDRVHVLRDARRSRVKCEGHAFYLLQHH